MSDPIVGFLRARLAEEEQVVRTLDEEYGNQVTGIEIYTDRDYGPIIAIGQKRALDEIAAKRRILDACALPLVEMTGLGDAERWFVPGEGAPWAEPVLRLLALPYSDHADYRAEWAPDLG